MHKQVCRTKYNWITNCHGIFLSPITNIQGRDKVSFDRDNVSIGFFDGAKLEKFQSYLVTTIQKLAMETRAPCVAFLWRQDGNVSKLTCLQNQKSGNGDKVSLCGFFMETSCKCF